MVQILKDRQKEFEDKNLSLCENKCKYLGYNISNQQSTCVCEVKNQMETVSEIINNPNKLSNEFSSNTKSTSANKISIECTYVLFTVDGLKSNIASYLLSVIIMYFLFSILSFLKCGYQLLKMKIQNILSDKAKKADFNKINKRKTEGIYNNKNIKNKKVNHFFPPQKLRIRFINNKNPSKRYHKALRSSYALSNFYNKTSKTNIFKNKIENDEKQN